MGRRSPPDKRERLNLAISPSTRERLQDLQQRTDAATMSEVIRRALAIYDDLLGVTTTQDGKPTGKKVAILGETGEPEEIVRLLP